jgi:BED zinc finger
MDVHEEDVDDPEVESASSSKGALVWKHFLKNEANKGKCKYCSKVLSIPTGTTSTLSRHLRCAHPIQYAAYSKDQALKSSLNIKNRPKPSGSQQSIVSFGFGKKAKLPATNPKAKTITKNIALMLVENYLPYSLVESTSFRNLMEDAEPAYQVPCRTTFSRSIIPKMYTSTKDIIQQELNKELLSLNAISVTTDMWTSRANESYMSLTAIAF